MIYALIMCVSVGQPYERCSIYPESSPVIYKTLDECKYYERLMKQAFQRSKDIVVECRGKHVESWEPVQ